MRLELHKLAHLARFERRKRMQQKKIDRILKEKQSLKKQEGTDVKLQAGAIFRKFVKNQKSVRHLETSGSDLEVPEVLVFV